MPADWGIYISVPFCRFKCTYCNFASDVFRSEELERYVEALAREIGACNRVQADSLYFGGGTPSMLSIEQIRSVSCNLQATVDVTHDAEITIEAAPGSITPELACAWVRCGINRASLGVQSFVAPELRATGRPHTAETVAADCATLRAAGIGNIGFDLIAGLPHQTAATWQESLDWVGRLQPEHVSVYMLEIDEDSHLGAEVLAGGSRYSAAALPADDAVADFYCRAVERLRESGYRQYEISNFALPGCESRHNRKYWTGASYLGFGVDAHSYDGRMRWANTDSVEDYVAKIERGESPVVERRVVDNRARLEERMFLGLRCNDGVELDDAVHGYYRHEIDELRASGLLEFANGRLWLTDQGRLLSNEVFAEFLECGSSAAALECRELAPGDSKLTWQP